MAFFVEMTARIGWVPNGSGNTFLAQQEANIPGQGQTNLAHAGMMSQIRQYIAGEGVQVQPGTESAVTLAQINTALTSCVADISGASGTPFITAAELAIIQGWAAGNP